MSNEVIECFICFFILVFQVSNAITVTGKNKWFYWFLVGFVFNCFLHSILEI